MPEIQYDQFLKLISKLPHERQVELMHELFAEIYADSDDQVFRVMATAIKHAKENQIEGADQVNILDSDLSKLSHIQDKNRLIQNPKKA